MSANWGTRMSPDRRLSELQRIEAMPPLERSLDDHIQHIRLIGLGIRDLRDRSPDLIAPHVVTDLLDSMTAEVDQEWLQSVARDNGVSYESLAPAVPKKHVEWKDRFTEAQLAPIYQLLKNFRPADSSHLNSAVRFITALSARSGIPVGTLKRWRKTLVASDDCASPHSGSRSVAAMTLTPEQERGLKREIGDKRGALGGPEECVTSQWVCARAAVIHQTGLYLDGVPVPGASDEPADVGAADEHAGDGEEDDPDPIVEMPGDDPERLYREVDQRLYQVVEELSEEEEEEESFEDGVGGSVRLRAQFGHSWFSGFAKRNGLSLLVAHAKRRPDARPERESADQEFILLLQREIREAYSRGWKWTNSYLNMDETCMRFIMTRQRTVEEKGARNVKLEHKGNDKACLTLIAWVTPGGLKGPLIVVMKGSTWKCEETMRQAFADEILRGELIVTRTISGWVDTACAQWFLQTACEWVQEIVSHRAKTGVTPTVVWDVYASHRCEETTAWAKEIGVQLRFIPAGKTDAIQPLDQKIFGELKSRARAKATAAAATKGTTEVKSTEALRHFLDAWKEIESDNIVKAWQTILK